MNKSRHVTFRCTQEEYQAIKEAADQQELSVSGLILVGAMEIVDFCRENPYAPPAISKHHLDRERQLENRFKDKS